MSPNIHKAQFDKDTIRWVSDDDAYMATVNDDNWFIPFISNKFVNLYSVGTHSGHATNHFTSMESAMTNGIAFCHRIIDKSRDDFPIITPFFPTDLLKLVVVVLMLVVIYKLIHYKKIEIKNI